MRCCSANPVWPLRRHVVAWDYNHVAAVEDLVVVLLCEPHEDVLAPILRSLLNLFEGLVSWQCLLQDIHLVDVVELLHVQDVVDRGEVLHTCWHMGGAWHLRCCKSSRHRAEASVISKAAAKMGEMLSTKCWRLQSNMLNSNTSLNMLSKTVMLSYTSTIMLAEHVKEVYDKKRIMLKYSIL